MGQFRRRGRFFPRRGPALPLCTGAFFRRGGPVLLPNPAGNGKHKSSHRRKKVGAVFYIPDFMEIQTPRAFPNCPEQRRDNSESAEDFSPDKGRLSRYAPAHFCRGVALLFPQSRREWETQKFPPRKKVGVVFYIPDCMKIRIPRAFPNCPGQWRDNPESAKDFSPGEGDSPVTHRRIFAERRPFLLLNPAGNGKHKSSHRGKRWE